MSVAIYKLPLFILTYIHCMEPMTSIVKKENKITYNYVRLRGIGEALVQRSFIV